MNEWGKKVSGCNFCVHADKESMKCHPNSDDCKKEYDLEKTDFNGTCNCDFYNER